MALVELTASRTLNGKVFQDTLDPQHRTLVSCIGLHYDTGSGLADVDMTPVRVQNAQLDGWRITANSWHYALGQPAGKADGWVGFGGRRGAHWLQFRLARVGYLRWSSRTWQDIGGAPTYNRANLSQQTESMTVVEGTTVNASATVTWDGIWTTPAGSISLRWGVGTRLKEDIVIPQAVREWIAANRPPTTPASQTYFGFVFQVGWSDIPKVLRQKAVTSVETDFDDGGGIIELRDAADAPLGFLPMDSCIVRSGGQDVARTPIRKRFYKDGSNYYLLIGVRCDVLNGLPAGDLIFDPTLDTQPDDTTAIDTTLKSDDADTAYDSRGDTTFEVNGGTTRFLYKFDLSSLAGATINSATLYLQVTDGCDWGSSSGNIWRILAANSGWVEGATWNYANPTSVRWAGDAASNGGSDAGCSVSGTDHSSTSMCAFDVDDTFTAGNKSFSLNTTEFASMVGANYGFVLFAASGGDIASIANSKHATASYRPRLVVDYTSGSSPQSVNLDALTLASTLNDIDATPGAVSVLMDALTLATTLNDLTLVSVVSVVLDALTLAGSTPSIAVTPGAVSVTLDALTLFAAAQDITVSPGAVSALLDALTITSSIPSASVVATVAVALDALTLAGSVGALSVTPGAVSLVLDALTLLSSVGTLSVTPGGVSIVLDALTLAGSAGNLTVTPGAIAVVLDALILAGSTPAITVTPGAVSIVLDALTLASTPLDLLVEVAGSTTVLLDALTLASSVPSLSVLAGAVSVVLDALTLSGTVQDLSIVSTVSVLLDALTVVMSVPSITVTPGAVSVLLDALTLTSAPLDLTVTPGGVSVALDALSVAATLPDLGVTPGAIAVLLDALALVASVESLYVSLGNQTVLLGALTLSSQLLDLTVRNVVWLNLSVTDVAVHEVGVVESSVNTVAVTDAFVWDVAVVEEQV